MTITQRNSVFEQYQNLIGYTVRQHMSLLKVLRMDMDDLRQELAICLLKAIEKYQPNRGAKESTFYFKMLRYGVLNLWRTQIRKVRLANLHTVPLTYSTDDGEEFTIELPFHVDYDAEIRVREFLKTLAPRERDALMRMVRGDDPEDKRHKRFMYNVKRKALQYNLSGGAI